MVRLMLFQVLACPQCGAPLPRQARWRLVNCPSCNSVVTRAEETVQAARFREALARSQAEKVTTQEVHWHGHRYRILGPLGRGVTSEILLGHRLGPLGERVTLKLARPGAEPDCLAREVSVLQQVRAACSASPGFFAQSLPEPIGFGISEGPYGKGQELVIFRHSTGFWGTLADVLAFHPEGLDPRHAVWIWRRVLGVLALVHDSGWVHGDLAPEHLLVHPQDHGILIIGWSQAHHRVETSKEFLSLPTTTRDLTQTAWSIRALLCGAGDVSTIPTGVPGPLKTLLSRCCEDVAWCASQNARSLDHLLQEASLQSFGPPRFIPFLPDAGKTGLHS